MNGRHDNHPADVQHPLRRRRLLGAGLGALGAALSGAACAPGGGGGAGAGAPAGAPPRGQLTYMSWSDLSRPDVQAH